MKKRILAAVLSLILVLSIAPTVSFAAEYTITNSGVYKLSDYGNGSKIAIKARGVILFGDANKDYSNIQIVCNSSDLLLMNVSIHNTTSNLCALTFINNPNTLLLGGKNTVISGSGQPGVKVEQGATLSITGSGTLNAQGGMYAAGIGGADNGSCGNINIYDTTVTAVAGHDDSIYGNKSGNGGGAGIGGGRNGSYGVILVTDSTVTATGGFGGAGIGSSSKGTGGTICIYSGTVKAQGGVFAAGLGGGYSGASGTIGIMDGTVHAYGGVCGSGIGGGYESSAGIILMYDGTVYAYGQAAPGLGDQSKTSNGSINISGGRLYSGIDTSGNAASKNMSVTISGKAAVIANMAGKIPHTNSSSRKTFEYVLPVQHSAFGLAIPTDWVVVNAYIAPVKLTYDANGGSGTTNEIYHIDTQAVLTDGNRMQNGTLVVTGWNTSADGTGQAYTIGADLPMSSDIKLYAQWGKQPVSQVSVSCHAETLNTGDTAKLTASVLPHNASYPLVSWTSSNDAVATVNKNGLVTAVKAGSAVIMATADGVSDTCQIMVSQLAEGVMVLPSSQALSKGATAELTAVVAPEDTTDAAVTWTSSDPSVAKVNSKGVVTALKAGKAVITASANGHSDSCEVYVASMMINLKLYVGSTFPLCAAVASDGDMVWKSSNTRVARVDEDGVVTAVGEGSAVITLKADGNTQLIGVLVDLPEVAHDNAGVITPSITPGKSDESSTDLE
jgi:uncharacterized protein YjdB